MAETISLATLFNVENINQEATDAFEPPPPPAVPEESHAPNNPPWNSIAALLLWVLSVVLILLVPAIVLIPYAISQNTNFANQEQIAKFLTNDQTAILLQIGAIIPAHIITLIAAWFLVTRFRQFSFTEMLGWEWGGFRWWHTIAILIGIFAIAIATTSIFGNQDNEMMRLLRSSRYAVFLVAFMATFSAPIVEEVIYRGVLYSAFQKTFNVATAVVLVTLVFALVHFPQYWGDIATLITLTCLSLVITLIRVKTDNLLPCIFFHFVFNGVQSLLLILQPYLPEYLDSTKPSEAIVYLLT